MKFNDERKQTILQYILEKIAQKTPSLSKTVADTFGVNASTIHAYINEMLDKKIIEKKKRGEYELIDQEYHYQLSRKNGDLDDDIYAYNACLCKHIETFSDNVKDIWSYTFSEMINNVMDHSCAENVHIVIKQNYLITTAAVLDDGVGIFKKIKEHFGFSSIDDAICELFKGKLTTDTMNHSGEGIFFSSRLMDEFLIVSDGRVFTINKYDDSKVMDLPIENQHGTCVIMGLSNFSQKKAKEIFDAFSDEDGGFTKTKISLKNIFGTSPVSRSQAKRVSNRLDSFEEVIVDFTDVAWMGQGFAHQLFVVFAKNHPDISIIPVNMNEDVTKMYNHVIQST